jgi:hypothetical protein
MYTVPPSTSAISLFTRFGRNRSFSSLAHAYRELGYAWISKNVRGHFFEVNHVDRYADVTLIAQPLYHEADFILRDDGGAPLTATDFYHLLPSLKSRRQCLLSTWNGSGPVPGTARRRRGRYYRRVGTLSEKRAAQSLSEYDEPAPRAARSASSLPSSWDDIQRSRRGDGWKQHRAQQWRERAPTAAKLNDPSDTSL